MKTLWARVGMSIDITDAEHEKLIQLINNGDDDMARAIISKLFLNQGRINGDSYMPGNYCNGCEDNPNKDEFDLEV